MTRPPETTWAAVWLPVPRPRDRNRHRQPDGFHRPRRLRLPFLIRQAHQRARYVLRDRALRAMLDAEGDPARRTFAVV
jgi:hypothetical protein